MVVVAVIAGAGVARTTPATRTTSTTAGTGLVVAAGAATDSATRVASTMAAARAAETATTPPAQPASIATKAIAFPTMPARAIPTTKMVSETAMAETVTASAEDAGATTSSEGNCGRRFRGSAPDFQRADSFSNLAR